MKKISLIGMPGCGKTTIGKILSKKFDMKFIDSDEYIEKNIASVKELFEKGEHYFRDIEEKAVLQILIRNESFIFAAGGGIVERQENIEALRKYSKVVFIDRPLKMLIETADFETRPLLKKGGAKKLGELYKERYKKYVRAADIIVKNNAGLDEAASKIVMILNNTNT